MEAQIQGPNVKREAELAISLNAKAEQAASQLIMARSAPEQAGVEMLRGFAAEFLDEVIAQATALRDEMKGGRF